MSRHPQCILIAKIMLEEFEDFEVCRTCAECCKRYSYLTGWEEEVERLALFETDLIAVVRIREGLWKVTINVRCKHLVQQGETFSCAIYHDRPAMCREYPQSIIRSGDAELIRQARLVCRLIP
ncbi:MAG: YkgJ family cysteine cluster protein [Methanobacteriota archaeon]|nr:MAG: YkgJ family cysteine cluster protein [Euryarchaeota archaeon]